MFCFLCWENGISVPTKEPEMVRKAIEGKMSVNLQIKLWSEDIGILLMPEELLEYCKEYPKWVFDAVLEQSRKRYMKEVGFVPTFLIDSDNNSFTMGN